jgi:hypothetical protein
VATFFDILTIFVPKSPKKRMKQTLFSMILVALLTTACSSGNAPSTPEITAYNEEQPLPGDSTVYGLACEGCTDSLLVFLPFTGGDPDTIDILNARVQRRVFGRPEIGDMVAVVLSANNKSEADIVINIDRLKGEWCYMVKPHLRPRAGASADSIVQLPPDFPDSLRQKWFQPREYGVEIRRDYTARPIGIQRSNADRQNGPVIYPEVKRYREWRIYNGHLLLSEARRDTLGNQQITNTDTADIVFMRHDTLLLRFSDHEQGYYRKN